jgi:hypothetical protein
MNEIYGNIWEKYVHSDDWIVIPTNGFVKKNGRAVMGRGLAFVSSSMFPDLPGRLGFRITKFGNRVFLWHSLRLFTFPVKNHWYDKADLNLIKQSSRQLKSLCKGMIIKVLIPRVGCGSGGLDWEEVKPILEKTFNRSSKFTIINPKNIGE